MALVNAFQNSSHDAFHRDQQAGEPNGQFMKIRSIWPFPVRNNRQSDSVDCELAAEGAGELVAPSSFIT